MLLMMFLVSFVGFALSVMLHFLILFQYYAPPRGLLLSMNTVAALVIYAAVEIAKRTCKQSDWKDIKKIITSHCPKWISVFTGTLIVYAFAGLLYFAFQNHFGDLDSISGRKVQNFSGHWMSLYALAFSILYSAGQYARSLEEHNNSEAI